MGKAAIVVHERKQFCACLVNRLQTDAEVFFLWEIGAGSKSALPVHVLFQFLQQGFAQRGNRCDSIHDFVGQNTDEFDPRVNLLVAQLMAHITDGDDAHWLVFDHGSGLMFGEMLILQLLPYLVEMGAVMVVKAGPKGEWHCQPDNGTFDLWFNGKNLFPDSGSYIYAGPGEVQKMRDWFRQTCVHNTLTLDNKNLETTESKTLLWQPDGNQQVLVTQNPSYKDLDHRRTVFFVDQTYYVIVDEALGSATGNLNLHYLLTDGKTSTEKNTIRTDYKGESNVMIACNSASPMELKQEEGWYSTAYRKKIARPSFSFNVDKKDAKPVRFVTIIYPGKDVKSVSAAGKVISSTDKSLKVSVKVNGKKQQLSWNIQ